jgi:succinate dehydrogenase/fumarate reductase flavoprotein subunit
MWTALGVIRNAPAMEHGLTYARSLGGELEALRPKDPVALRDWVELGFLRDVAVLSLTAALARTESRGAHYREDLPDEDPAWARAIVLRRDGGGNVTWSAEASGAAVRTA